MLEVDATDHGTHRTGRRLDGDERALHLQLRVEHELVGGSVLLNVGELHTHDVAGAVQRCGSVGAGFDRQETLEGTYLQARCIRRDGSIEGLVVGGLRTRSPHLWAVAEHDRVVGLADLQWLSGHFLALRAQKSFSGGVVEMGRYTVELLAQR